MVKQILYGVGKSVLKDWADPKAILALSKLKDLSIQFSGDEEAVSGGDSPYPLAYFPKDKSITVTATNALFDLKMFTTTQGATVTTGAVDFTEFIEGDIPSDGIFAIEYAPIAGTTIIEGFTEVADEVSVAAGKFFVDTANKTIVFDAADAGKSADGIYERVSAETSQTVSVTTETFAKPFVFTHRIPVYDDNNAVVSQGQLVIFKCKANNKFDMGLAPSTAFAPKIEFQALEARRPDKKLWDFTLEPVA